MLDMLAGNRRARPYQRCWLVSTQSGPCPSVVDLFDSSNVSAANEFPGAKLGANNARHQATPGHVQPELPQVNGT